ncbi:MAG TPA: hypothetical protein PLB05_01470 [Candidatus Omnitrophota bacterium]|nr:hypothetical protein [Candidatus Omnitrophota bacterium]
MGSPIKNAVSFVTTHPLLLLVTMTAAVFSPVLFHGFVGDDLAFIVYNRFYDSPSHIPHLWSEKYLTRGHDVLFGNTVNFTSGSVSYRPVLSATFFMDRWLWARRPFGYHLHNLILHVLNVLLVFMLIMKLSRDHRAALFGAALFAIHPVQAEAVSVAGYRADLLAGFFLLGAFVSFVSALEGKGQGHPGLWGLSWGLYTLAVFAKESALAFPVLLAGYFFILKRDQPEGRSVPVCYYAGIAAATGFYLYMYFFVFPNTTFRQLKISPTWVMHLVRVLEIFYFNIQALFCPWAVKIVPGGYRPWGAGSADWGLLTMVMLLYGLFRSFRMSPAEGFFIFWFFAAYFPVAHFIPLVNPAAHRYLYVPLAGLSAAVALWGEEMIKRIGVTKARPWGMVAQVGLLLICVLKLGSLNAAWKNDLTLAKALIKAHPRHRAGYQSLGMIAFQNGDCPTAVQALQQSVLLGARDPRVLTFLGDCLKAEPDKAGFFFREAIKEYPRFHLPYKGMGEIMLRTGDLGQALWYARENMRLVQSPRPSDYDLLIAIYTARGEGEKAVEIARQKERLFPARAGEGAGNSSFRQEAGNAFLMKAIGSED